jgi:hypothetical protein
MLPTLFEVCPLFVVVCSLSSLRFFFLVVLIHCAKQTARAD